MKEQNKMLSIRKGKKNAKPVLSEAYKFGLHELAKRVSVLDTPEVIKAAQYIEALARYLDSPEYQEKKLKGLQAVAESRAKRGLKPVKKSRVYAPLQD